MLHLVGGVVVVVQVSSAVMAVRTGALVEMAQQVRSRGLLQPTQEVAAGRRGYLKAAAEARVVLVEVGPV